MDRLILRLETLGAETLARVNELFRKKVQIEEQLTENEADLHFFRGHIGAIDKLKGEFEKSFEGGELDKALMKLNLIGSQALTKADGCFRVKVQKEEELAEVMVNLHFYRGVLATFDRCQKVAREIQQGDQIEAMELDHPIKFGNDNEG